MMRPLLRSALAAVLALFATQAHAADKPIKAFILAGQSNMVGWGHSTKLTNDFRKGNDRVVMFENGKWQPFRPHEPANRGQRWVGLTEFHFGPEIAFGHEMAKAWPGETIGIIKFAIASRSPRRVVGAQSAVRRSKLLRGQSANPPFDCLEKAPGKGRI